MSGPRGRRGDGDAGSPATTPAAKTPAATTPAATTPAERAATDAEIGRLRERIDDLDRRIVALLNERASLGLGVGRAKAAGGRRTVRDPRREREVLLRVAMANDGPLGQAELLSIYRRIVAATRELEVRDRDSGVGGEDAGRPGPG